MLLRELGVDPSGEPARRAIDRVRENIRWWQLDGQPFFDGETEACINGRILAAGAYFGAASNRLVDRLLGEQLEDGGWNCEAPPSTRSSFNSTICVLEGMLEYEKAQGPSPEVTDARLRGQDYLLDRHLFRSRTTGEVINPSWMRFSFPTVWYYDVLRALDYLRRAGAAPDERMTEALKLLDDRQDRSGRWPLDTLHADRVRIPFDLETGIGAPSRWNTLRALRVLDWFEGPRP